ncbi:MAG: aminofutalosine synthase MqnE [SAR324 cluster bacterium]|nr:aminofutalosine synthase MqnE [SAR324 cluster bacterium]
MPDALKSWFSSYPDLARLADAVVALKPLSIEDGLDLYQKYPLEVVRLLADARKHQLHGKQVFYNHNIHIEPTNKCVYSCKFCAFYRTPKASEAEGAWDYSHEEIEHIMESHTDSKLTEVHITGGVHRDHELEWWAELIRKIKRKRPGIHVKAYTAVEIAYMARKSEKSLRDVLQYLKDAGLDSLPGGGAEIFNTEVRRKIAGGKAPAHQWLEVHETAHQLGLFSNATMLYGHVESLRDRCEHMILLRDLQERTGGFKSFIPLKFRNENNALSGLQEITMEEDLRNYAVSRLMLHNIPHLKAYWVMIGMETAQKSLNYGVDDMDGTINDSTRIYSMAGSMKHPSLTTDQLQSLIKQVGLTPVERDSQYHPLSG